MNARIHTSLLALALTATLGIASLPVTAAPQPATVTYQGQLKENGQPFTGTANLDIRLYDAITGGNLIAQFDGANFQNYPILDGLLQVELPFIPGDFDGDQRWIEIRVDGAILTPRQPVNSAPYAVHALSVSALALDGTELQPGSVGSSQIDNSQVQQRVNGICGSGKAVASVNANGSVNCIAIDAFGWSLGGNAGTNPANNFIGTTDSQPLVFKVDSSEVLRITEDSSAQTVSGFDYIATGHGLIFEGNAVDVDAVGSVVLGGGNLSVNGVDAYSGNSVQAPSAPGSAPSWYVSIGGGISNQAAGFASTVSGGFSNTADGASATISGGGLSSATADYTTVAGGGGHTASGDYATISGGSTNTATDWYATVGGGSTNDATGDRSTISGGASNNAVGSSSAIGGGNHNDANGSTSTIAGGVNNVAAGASSTVGGGLANHAMSDDSTVAGGNDNVASGIYATVAGGYRNTASGRSAIVAGGESNCAGGAGSLAAGYRAKIRPGADIVDTGTGCSGVPTTVGSSGDFGTFLWADNKNYDFVSTGTNKFEVRATGGVRFVSAVDGSGVATAGVSLASGAGAWANLSDRNAKTDIEAVDPQDALARVLALPIYTWRYKSQSEGIRHMGPMAQDFHAAFELNGEDDRHISTIDPDGAALAAIQGLNARLEAENAALRAALEKLERRMDALEHDSRDPTGPNSGLRH